MFVIKRNGTQEKVSFDKITARLESQSKSLKNVNITEIAQMTIARIYNGIKTEELDRISAKISEDKKTINPEYSILAKNILVSNLHKNTSYKFSECFDFIRSKLPKLWGEKVYDFIMKYSKEIDEMIIHDNDYQYDTFGFSTLETKYLKKYFPNPKEKKTIVYDRPQYLLMRVAIQIHYNKQNPIEQILRKIKKTYKYYSYLKGIPGSPALYNACTRFPQHASCIIVGTEDSCEGITKTQRDCAILSKHAFGIGVHMSNVRGHGSYINGTDGNSDGLLNQLRVYQDTAKCWNQGGKRPGAFQTGIRIYHSDVKMFLKLRLKDGPVDERLPVLNYCIIIDNHFMERYINGQKYSLFSEDTAPGLSDLYGQEYVEQYDAYESEGRAIEVVEAAELVELIAESIAKTGQPFIINMDEINLKSNQKNIGAVKNTNLCTEIMQVSDSKLYPCCVLHSINLTTCVKQNVVKKIHDSGRQIVADDLKACFDLEELIYRAKYTTRILDRTIDFNYYPLPEARRATEMMRNIGIGTQGYDDVYKIMRLPFDSKLAKQLNVWIAEAIYYGAMYSSWKLAQKFGAYERYEGSPISQGIFQFNMWNVDESKLLYKDKWAELRTNIMTKGGVRNSLTTAWMPTASTSQILGNNECFEPRTALIYIRETGSGIFKVIDQRMYDHFLELNIDISVFLDEIIKTGSIQHIDFSKYIDNETELYIKKIYRNANEIPQSQLMQMSADRAPFVDQSQSLNLYLDPNSEDIIADIKTLIITGYKLKLKTISYYMHSGAEEETQISVVDKNKKRKADELEMSPEDIAKMQKSKFYKPGSNPTGCADNCGA